MKTKLLIIGLLMGYGFQSNAQITVYSSTMPSPGDIVRTAYDNDTNFINTPPGINLMWNYSSLDSIMGIDTMNYVLPNSTPYGSLFPTSTVAEEDNGDFFKTTNASFELVGVYDGNKITGSNSITMFKFPLQYGNTNSDAFAFYSIEAGGGGSTAPDSIRYFYTGTKSYRVDSWGQLTLPTGTFDVLRLKDTFIIKVIEEELRTGTWAVTSTYYDTTYKNLFISDNIKSKYILMEQTLNSNGKIGSTDWNIISPSLAGINENEAKIEFNLFPNPTADILNIKSKNSFNEFVIKNIIGQVILRKKGINITKINVSTLDEGQYILTLLSNNRSFSKKFTAK